MRTLLALNQFDAILYINLNHRRDREKLLLADLKALGVDEEKIYRIEAVHDLLNGHRGCALSHKKALQISKDNGWKNVLILEDDAFFTKSSESIQKTIEDFFNHFSKQWDVFFLAANVFEAKKTKISNFKKILSAQCAHAYAVNNCYYDVLIECFDKAYLEMKDDIDASESLFKAIDQKWKDLQPRHRWYMGDLLGQQRPSYSDIDHKIRSRIHQEFKEDLE